MHFIFLFCACNLFSLIFKTKLKSTVVTWADLLLAEERERERQRGLGNKSNTRTIRSEKHK